jgi:parallel beta-helix repeat protein
VSGFCFSHSNSFSQRVVFTVFFVAVALSCHCAFAATWYVKADGSGDATTIQAGVDSATVGDTVLVAAGIYTDSAPIMIGGVPTNVAVYVSKNISLVAEGAVTIEGPQDGVGIVAQNVDADCIVAGFRIRTSFTGFACAGGAPAPTTAVPQGRAIHCIAAPIRIEDNELFTNAIGVALDASSASLVGNHIHTSLIGIECLDGSDADIAANQIHDCASLISTDSSSPQIHSNVFYADAETCAGIAASGGAPHVFENEFRNLRTGVQGASNAIVEDNRFEQNGAGLVIGGSSTVVRNNLFYRHTTVIETWGTGGRIEHNTIDDCGTAVLSQTTTALAILNNIIVRAGNGILLPAGTHQIQCNDLFAITGTKYGGGVTDLTGIAGNFSLDPEFCGIDDSNNYLLQSDSPCAVGNHPDGVNCGLIGAFDVGCSTVSTKQATWGSIKSKYRER